MLDVFGGSFVAGNEGSLRYQSTGSDTLNDLFDFDIAALDSWIDPQQFADDFFAQPIHQNQYPTDGVLQFELLEEKNDSAYSETQDLYPFDPLTTGPAAPNFFIRSEHIKLREPIASIDNRPQPAFAGIEIYCPNRESKGVVAEKEYSKTTKKRKFSQTPPRKKSKTIDDGSRKRAQHGNTCVRCRLQKGKCCGGFPCEGCTGKILWQNICVRAKLQELCFVKGGSGNTGVYRTRVHVMLENVQRWIPVNEEPLVEIRVGIGYKASLPVKVNKFLPIDQTLLEQASFRKNADVESPPTPWRAGPYGLKDSFPLPADLDKFFDEMVQELVENEFEEQRDPIWAKAVYTAHQRSLYVTRKDVSLSRFLSERDCLQSRILRNVLRMWAAQRSYAMDHMWRVSDGADKIGSEFHPGLGASVTPRTLMWQLDAHIEKYLQDLEKKIIDDFDRLVFPPRDGHRSQSTWLSTFLAAYIYLACLETDTWIILGWKVKTERWKLDPVLARNRTMQWPLNVDPSVFVDRNEHQAKVVVGHMRALTQGRLPFSKVTSGDSIEVKLNINSPDEDTRAFAESFKNDFIDLAQKLNDRGREPYREDDQHSLEYLFLAKLLIDP